MRPRLLRVFQPGLQGVRSEPIKMFTRMDTTVDMVLSLQPTDTGLNRIGCRARVFDFMVLDDIVISVQNMSFSPFVKLPVAEVIQSIVHPIRH